MLLHRHHTEDEHGEHVDQTVLHHDTAHARFGGANAGAAFFGWLVAMGVSILLTGVIGAVVTGAGSTAEVTQSEAERQAGTIGVAAAITLLAVLMIGYYAGGYVAGRMSRYDGARQGASVWLIGLLVPVVAIALGAIFGNEYNVLDRVDVPRIPLSTEELGWGGAITAAAVVVLTLVAAMLGGKAGHHYHHKVDRVLREG